MRITAYDFNNLYYSSFFITGFVENAARADFHFRISHRVPDLFTSGEMDQGKYPSILFSMCLFKVESGNQEFYFVVDTHDSHLPIGYHLPLLSKVKVYFKVNFNHGAMQSSPELAEHAEKISPIFPFFPIKSDRWSVHLPKMTPDRRVKWKGLDILRRFKAVTNILTLDELKALRMREKQHDIFFLMTYYGSEVHAQDEQLRFQIMHLLRNRPKIKSITGFCGKQPLPEKFATLRHQQLSFRNYMKTLASSRIAIYVRGLHQCHSFKMPEQLALGLPIVGQPIINSPHEFMHFPHFDQQYCHETPESIVENIVTLLEDESQQRILADANAETFDTHFTPKVVVARMIEKLQAVCQE